jgi:hypothetical protein
MRPGWVLQANKETKPTDTEQIIIRAVIRDCHTTSIGEWLVNQKPKIRAKFMKFLETVRAYPPPSDHSNASGDVAERFARDICNPEYHPMLRPVIDASDGEYADVLHILSLHMARANVMASIPSVKDRTPELFKAIAQEDHVYSRPSIAKHEIPKIGVARALSRGRMVDPLPPIAATRSFKPTWGQTSTPFAMFPTGEPIQSMSRSQFVSYKVQDRTKPSGVYNVLNMPTCL